MAARRVLDCRIMKRRAVTLLFLSMAALSLTGCLFTVNDPLVAPDGTLAVFLGTEGDYTLFPENGVLHLFRDDAWTPIPAATIEEAGGLFDLSPDGTEALYVKVTSDVDSGDWGDLFSPFVSSLYRCALHPDAAPEQILQTTSAIAKAEWVRGDRILMLVFGEEGLGTLHAVDPTTAETSTLAENLLSFATVGDTDALLLFAAHPETEPARGRVDRWDPITGERRPVATFVLHEGTIESFAALPHRLFWDVSSDGQWLALGLYDGTLLSPSVETELPALYLIDLVLGEAERIAAEALMPAFAPDGSGLVYAAESDDGLGMLMWHALPSGTSVEVPGSLGISTATWLGPTTLAMTFEGDEDRHRLVALDVETETIRVLVELPVEDGD